MSRLSEVWPARPDPPPRDTGRVVVPLNGQTPPYAAAALASEIQAVADTPEGSRNHRLNTAAFNLGTLVAAGHLDEHHTADALRAAGLAAGLTTTETDNTIRSGLVAGAQHPRDIPPDETRTPAVTVVDMDDLSDVADIEKLLPIVDWHASWTREDREEWILEPLLPVRRAVALYSAPKVGKSLLMLEIAANIAQGTETLGVTPDRPRRVLYVDFENDPQGDILTRLEAMDLGPDDLENLCYMSFPSLPHLDTAMGGIHLVTAAQHYQCEVVVIDTVSRAVGGEENANDTWLAFYRNTGLALKTLGIACIRLDHTGKDHTKGMRGGSAKYGDVDAVWKLEATSAETWSLECTDSRMPIPQKILHITRQSFPLRHLIMGDHWADVLDAQARHVDEELDRLGVPTTASVRDCGRRLRESGVATSQGALSRAVRARKMRLDIPSEELNLWITLWITSSRHAEESVTVTPA